MTIDLAQRLAHELAGMPTQQKLDAHRALIAMRDRAVARSDADLDLAHLITKVLQHTQGATP